jgi:hypothetical protein
MRPSEVSPVALARHFHSKKSLAKLQIRIDKHFTKSSFGKQHRVVTANAAPSGPVEKVFLYSCGRTTDPSWGPSYAT